MAAEGKIRRETDAPNKGLVAGLTLLVCLTLGGSIGGSYLVAIHEGRVAVQEAEEQGRMAAAKALHAQQVAEEGKSRSLCGALLEMARTPAAHKLHPVFVKVYNNTGCVEITGRE